MSLFFAAYTAQNLQNITCHWEKEDAGGRIETEPNDHKII